MIVGATHIERICSFETKHDAVLIVDAHGVKTSTVTGERVQPIPGRHLQVLEPGNRVELIELPAHDRPQLAGDAPGRFAVDTVPDIPRGVVGERPNHRIAL